MRTSLLHLLCTSAILIGTAGAGHAATTIVNINGTGSDGAGVATGYTYPLAPGSLVAMVHPVVVDLAAGDYTVSDGW